jgi:hypothetical protein
MKQGKTRTHRNYNRGENIVFIFGFRYGNVAQWGVPSIMKRRRGRAGIDSVLLLGPGFNRNLHPLNKAIPERIEFIIAGKIPFLYSGSNMAT